MTAARASANQLSSFDFATFGKWLERWRLEPDGQAISGPNSRLLPVRRDGQPLMLKAAMQPREVRAAAYLEWLGGNGAVSVLGRDEDAVLMERAVGTRSLVEIDASGDHEQAFAVLCEIGARLHAVSASVPEGVLPLSAWFRRLRDLAASGEFFERMAQQADLLLSEEHDIRALHGDLHHWNVLDGGARGWLAIDPNGLMGERTFDFALMVLPTNLKDDTEPSTLKLRSQIVARHAHVDQHRLLQWVSVQAALWAAWSAPGRNWAAVADAAAAAALL